LFRFCKDTIFSLLLSSFIKKITTFAVYYYKPLPNEDEDYEICVSAVSAVLLRADYQCGELSGMVQHDDEPEYQDDTEQEGRKDIYGDTGYLATGEVCEE
jgi:hypothetical protein